MPAKRSTASGWIIRGTYAHREALLRNGPMTQLVVQRRHPARSEPDVDAPWRACLRGAAPPAGCLCPSPSFPSLPDYAAPPDAEAGATAESKTAGGASPSAGTAGQSFPDVAPHGAVARPPSFPSPFPGTGWRCTSPPPSPVDRTSIIASSDRASSAAGGSGGCGTVLTLRDSPCVHGWNHPRAMRELSSLAQTDPLWNSAIDVPEWTLTPFREVALHRTPDAYLERNASPARAPTNSQRSTGAWEWIRVSEKASCLPGARPLSHEDLPDEHHLRTARASSARSRRGPTFQWPPRVAS